MRKRETGFAATEASTCGVQVALILFNFDGHRGDIVVELSVPSDLPRETPVICIGHRTLQDVEVTPWSGEQVAEPWRQWFEWGVDTVVGCSVKVDGEGLLIRAVGTEITGYCAIIVEPDPLSLLVQPIADGDLKVSDFPIVDLVPLGRMIEGLLIVEDPLFEVVEAIFVTFGGHTGAGFSISDGLEEAIGNGA
jgi:hypothetical protein